MLETPKHTLQDEELSVLLKALDYYAKNTFAISNREGDVAVEIARELRNKAGWLRYEPSRPQEKAEVEESDSIVDEESIHPKKVCKVCED